MSDLYELTAEVRQGSGRGASRRLRLENKVPAILYGAEKDPITLSFNHYHVLKALSNEGFYSHILTLHINGEKQPAVLKDVQRHPFKPRILHMDFLRINPKEKITMHVPFHFLGGDKAPGLKQGGVITHILSNIEVRCLPADLPEYIEIDVSGMNVDDVIHLSEVKIPKGVEFVVFAHGDIEIHDTGVVKMAVPRVVEEVVETPVVATEVPAAKQAAPAAATPATAEKDKGKAEGKK